MPPGNPSVPLTAAVLAGGQSRRMGRDKALLSVDGETLLARTARIAGNVAATVLVVGRDRPGDWPKVPAVFLPDAAPDAGPLAGLIAALEHAPGPVLLLGCDMPLLDPDALHWLVAAAGDRGAVRATAAVVEGQLQPLFAIYTPDATDEARARLTSGRRSLIGLIEARAAQEQFQFADAPPSVARALADVDTPDDWAAASARH